MLTGLQCSQDLSSAGLQYVQPVQVVPVGGPVPAVAAQHHQYTVPVQSPHISDRDFSVVRPSHPARPQPVYRAPGRDQQGGPNPAGSYSALSYSAPAPVYTPTHR